jgi:pimeloyl-ACP methyl ester carboxylesterase
MQGGGNGPLADSAVEVEQKLTALTARLGVSKVDLIGHSEGGIMAQYIVKTDPDIASGVRSVTTISSPTHGTLGELGATLLDTGNLRDELPVPPAVKDLLAGSAFLQELNSGPITVPGVAYATISSRFDPISSFGQNEAILAEPGVDNYVLQNLCPGSKAGHNGTAFPLPHSCSMPSIVRQCARFHARTTRPASSRGTPVHQWHPERSSQRWRAPPVSGRGRKGRTAADRVSACHRR